MEIRPATPADLAQVGDIWYRAEVEDSPDLRPQGDVPGIFRHELETGKMYVAQAGSRIVGYTALITRGAIGYLAELYVRDDEQSSGVGQALLARALAYQACGDSARSAVACCTLSSSDPRALALYIRAGMQPRWPHFLLHAAAPQVTGSSLEEALATGIDVVPARPGDPELVRWDAEVGGRLRPEDHVYWVTEAAATPLWFVREGEAVGYGYVQARNHEVALLYPEALSLGPIGARGATLALECTLAAVAWAAEWAPALALGVPAAHPSLPVLLEAGFRIMYV
ncbi:MAG: GNAT family N-acetyltransferase, partial [Anaerolineae bacterium]